jgi:hypothetical protein
MANVNAPFGLKPVKHIDGSSWNQVANLYYIPSTDNNAYLIGDVVVSAANGNTLNGVSAVTLFGTRNAASTSGAVRGVVVGFGTDVATPGGPIPGGFDPDNLSTVQIPATKTKNYYVYVVDDPTVVFEGQVDTVAATAYNKNAPLFVANVPTAPANQSASYVQGSAANTTQALPLKIMGAPWRADNDLTGTGAFAKVYVKFNQHELLGNTAGV